MEGGKFNIMAKGTIRALDERCSDTDPLVSQRLNAFGMFMTEFYEVCGNDLERLLVQQNTPTSLLDEAILECWSLVCVIMYGSSQNLLCEDEGDVHIQQQWLVRLNEHWNALCRASQRLALQLQQRDECCEQQHDTTTHRIVTDKTLMETYKTP